MALQEITSSNFDQEVLKSDMLYIVDFWADWCMPCHMLSPVIEEVGEDYKDKIKVGKLNTDENPDIAAKYEIMSIPAVLFFKEGKEVARLIGVRPKTDFSNQIDSLL
ncbi:MAG: thioredoxin [Patescibacteria group bacterium]